MSSHQATNGMTNSWGTPPEIIERLGPFDDDPCPIGGEGGLERAWNGFVWLNPPYGQQTGAWLAKLAEHGNGIALVFARTETKMFFDHVWPFADSLLFIRGRLHFYSKDGERAKGNAGAPSVLIAYGEEADKRIQRGGIAGVYLKNQRKII